MSLHDATSSELDATTIGPLKEDPWGALDALIHGGRENLLKIMQIDASKNPVSPLPSSRVPIEETLTWDQLNVSGLEGKTPSILNPHSLPSPRDKRWTRRRIAHPEQDSEISDDSADDEALLPFFNDEGDDETTNDEEDDETTDGVR
ncbi:hypothetical protein HGRIS_012392 [Hohenbuehelia grisea]|uniref:Uncharacterized protein n=1 Tax=Hohenbuehelia grisea TaxID=104357 RepID=A0ABR3IS40_9AGAR